MPFELSESQIAFGQPEFWDAPVLKTVPQKALPLGGEDAFVDDKGDIELLTGVEMVASRAYENGLARLPPANKRERMKKEEIFIM